MDFFFGAPSDVQDKVDNATSADLPGVDWNLNMEIVDKINRAKDGGKDWTKAIGKRVGVDNHKVILLALELLDTCMKNCKQPFFFHVHKQKFLDRIVSASTNSKQDVKEKALQLIMTWAEAFAKHPDFPNFYKTYQALKDEGVEFPARDMSAMAPVFTPAPNKEAMKRQAEEKASNHPYASITDQYIKKIKSELKEVLASTKLLRDVLMRNEGPVELKKNGIAKQLARVLREMGSRLMRLIVEVEHELIVDLCLQVNEQVTIVLQWYKASKSGTPFDAPELVYPEVLKQDGGEADKPPTNTSLPEPVAAGTNSSDGFDTIARRDEPEQKEQNILGTEGGPNTAPKDEFEELLGLTDPK